MTAAAMTAYIHSHLPLTHIAVLPAFLSSCLLSSPLLLSRCRVHPPSPCSDGWGARCRSPVARFWVLEPTAASSVVCLLGRDRIREFLAYPFPTAFSLLGPAAFSTLSQLQPLALSLPSPVCGEKTAPSPGRRNMPLLFV